MQRWHCVVRRFSSGASPSSPLIDAPSVVKLALSGGAHVPRVVDVCGEPDYARAHAAGATWWPASDMKDPASPFGVVPTRIVAEMSRVLRVAGGAPTVVYSASALPSARLWWVLRYYGHGNVRVLDGGWRAYLAAGGRVRDAAGEAADAAATAAAEPAAFDPRPTPAMLASTDEVLAAVDGRGPQLIDCRTPLEYSGDDLRGLPRGGHPPGALNVPHAEFLAPDGRYKDAAALRAVFAARGVDLARPSIVYCLAGVRASVGVLALAIAAPGARVQNYDGSMAEWLSSPSLPAVKGTAVR